VYFYTFIFAKTPIMATTCTEADYVRNCTTLTAKITAIDTIIEALMDTALEAAANGGIEEYSLDNGQTKIRTKYRTAEDVLKSIKSWESLRNFYQYKITGRVTRLSHLDRIKGTTHGG
jgi:hypothetical protein